MSDVETRLQRLEDERDILLRLNTFGHCIDYGGTESFVDCFTDGGALTYSWDAANEVSDTGHAEDVSYRGREELAGFIATHTRAPEHRHKHVVVDPHIEIDGDQAVVTSYFVRLDRNAAGPVVSSFGRYSDAFARCPDGRWRIADRRGELESRWSG